MTLYCTLYILDNLSSSIGIGTEKEGSGSGNMILDIFQVEQLFKEYLYYIKAI